MTRKQLRRASFYLRREAKALRESNTLGPGHRWTADLADEHAEYDEMMLLARELQAVARDPSFVPID